MTRTGSGLRRRECLRRVGLALAATTSSVAAGCGTIGEVPRTATSSVTPVPVPATPAGLHTKITDHGHYTWFALTESTWARQGSPYDRTDGDSRWMAVPTREGGIRTLVKGIDYRPDVYQSSGFDLHLGPLGEISEIRIHSEEVQSGPLPAQLIVALYLDEDENGEFFVWEESDDGSDRWAGYGGDEMGSVASYLYVGETVRIDDETTFGMANRDSAISTLGELKDGEIEYFNERRRSGKNRGIDAGTIAAVYVGLIDNADGQPIEAIIEDVVVEYA